MFNWMRNRAWSKTGGYTCDGCGKWTPRRKGKAAVSIVRREVPKLGKLPAASVRVVHLDCPECTAESEEAVA